MPSSTHLYLIRQGTAIPEVYISRGKLKYTKLNDRAGGIADLKKALQLAKEGKNTEFSNMALKQLKSWGIN